MTLEMLDSDAAMLAAAGSVAEEALALHRDALSLLTDGWCSQSGSAATDLLRRQCGGGAELVTALHGAAAELRSLRDSLEEMGPHPDPSVGRADGDQPPFAQSSARLDDRPAPQFELPASPPVYGTAPPAPQAGPAWPLGAGLAALPSLGAGLVGLIAQIGDALSPDSAAPAPADDPAVIKSRADEMVATPIGTAAEPPRTPVLPPVAAPVERISEPATRIPVPESPPPPPPQLLAAERPPEPAVSAPDPIPPDAAPAAAEARTPCEIAADELPQVGQ